MMKTKIKLFFLCFSLFFNSCQTKKDVEQIDNDNFWNYEYAKKHYQKQNEMNFPIYVGSFPVAPYNTPGTGIYGNNLNIGSKDIIMKSMFVKRGPHNEHIFNGSNKKNEIVVNILSLTDDSSLSNPAIVSSRNHPNYLAEGTINCKNYKVDWITIYTADRNSYAVINMRFFDLKFGRTILVTPQKNKSVRFLQIETELLSNENLDAYIENLKNDKKVIDFFSKESNI